MENSKIVTRIKEISSSMKEEGIDKKLVNRMSIISKTNQEIFGLMDDWKSSTDKTEKHDIIKEIKKTLNDYNVSSHSMDI